MEMGRVFIALHLSAQNFKFILFGGKELSSVKENQVL